MIGLREPCSGLSENRAQRVEACRHDPIPHPQATLLALDQAGVDEDLHVVADRGLRAS